MQLFYQYLEFRVCHNSPLVQWWNDSLAKSLFIIKPYGFGACLNRLPDAGIGDMVVLVKKARPELRKKCVFCLAISALSLSECQALTMLDMLTSQGVDLTRQCQHYCEPKGWNEGLSYNWTYCKRIHMHVNLVMWSHYLSSSHMGLVNGACLNRFPDVGIGEICEKSQVEEEEFVCLFW